MPAVFHVVLPRPCLWTVELRMPSTVDHEAAGRAIEESLHASAGSARVVMLRMRREEGVAHAKYRIAFLQLSCQILAHLRAAGVETCVLYAGRGEDALEIRSMPPEMPSLAPLRVEAEGAPFGSAVVTVA